MKLGFLKKVGKWLLRKAKEDVEDKFEEIIDSKNEKLGIPRKKKRGK